MKRKYFLLVFAFISPSIWTNAEPDSSKVVILQSQINELRIDLKNQKKEIINEYAIQRILIDSLEKKVSSHKQSLSDLSESFNTKSNISNQFIKNIDNTLNKNTLLGIICVLITILLTGLSYWLLSRRQQIDKTNLIDQLSKTKSSIEESLVKEFSKQTELMESQLHLIELQKANLQATPNAESDHSLALKVADEITLIERNINLMDAGTKGLKQLSRSISILKDNLAANGYEIPELLGKPLNRGMHSIPVSSIPDENLEPGVEMITKIIKPQVNYNDKMIQAAQIEVSVGY